MDLAMRTHPGVPHALAVRDDDETAGPAAGRRDGRRNGGSPLSYCTCRARKGIHSAGEGIAVTRPRWAVKAINAVESVDVAA